MRKHSEHKTINYDLMLTSPEDELKEISFNQTLRNETIDSPLSKKRMPEKYTIESWNFSQQLPRKKKGSSSRYQQTISTNLQTAIRLNRNVARTNRSIISKEEIQKTNMHNFNRTARKSQSNRYSPQSQSDHFMINLKTFNSKDHSVERTQKASSQRPKTCYRRLSKKSIQLKSTIEKQQRLKTLQIFLAHQKQQIQRQRNILITNQNASKNLNIIQYPTRYQSGQRKKVKEARKKVYSVSNQEKVLVKHPQKQNQDKIFKLKNSSKKRYINNKKQSHQQIVKTSFKRFQSFLDNLTSARGIKSNK